MGFLLSTLILLKFSTWPHISLKKKIKVFSSRKRTNLQMLRKCKILNSTPWTPHGGPSDFLDTIWSWSPWDGTSPPSHTDAYSALALISNPDLISDPRASVFPGDIIQRCGSPRNLLSKAHKEKIRTRPESPLGVERNDTNSTDRGGPSHSAPKLQLLKYLLQRGWLFPRGPERWRMS